MHLHLIVTPGHPPSDTPISMHTCKTMTSIGTRCHPQSWLSRAEFDKCVSDRKTFATYFLVGLNPTQYFLVGLNPTQYTKYVLDIPHIHRVSINLR